MVRSQSSQRSATRREREEPPANIYSLDDMPEPKSEAGTFKAVVGPRALQPSAGEGWLPSEVTTVAATAASANRSESVCMSDTISIRRSGMALESKLRLCIMVICFGILCILVGEQTNTTVTDVDGHLLRTPPPSILDLLICAPAAGACLLWEVAELITVAARGRGIHPMAQIVMSFIIFLGMTAALAFQIVALMYAVRYTHVTAAYVSQTHAPGAGLSSALLLCLSGLYLTLFIVGVRQHKRNKRAAKLAARL